MCVCVTNKDLSRHLRCHTIDMAINVWKKNHFSVTLDVSAFHFNIFTVSPSFFFFLFAEERPLKAFFFSLVCSAALVIIITRIPSCPRCKIRCQFRSPLLLLVWGFGIKNILHRSSLCTTLQQQQVGGKKVQLFSINRDTIDLNMW